MDQERLSSPMKTSTNEENVEGGASRDDYDSAKNIVVNIMTVVQRRLKVAIRDALKMWREL